MGNAESAKKKQQRKELLKQMEIDSKKTRPFTTKKILLLHKSNAAQLEVLENFHDALITRTEGTVEVTNIVNVADGKPTPKNLSWLNEMNNVVLICLTDESIELFHKIILEKGFAGQNGQLHPKVFSVTFGESLNSKWPPKGLNKGSMDLRDFHFGFSDVENIRQEDFEGSLRLNSLIASIKLTH